MRGTTIAVSDSPEGPFTLVKTDGPIAPPNFMTLDGTLYVDRSGKPWMGVFSASTCIEFRSQISVLKAIAAGAKVFKLLPVRTRAGVIRVCDTGTLEPWRTLSKIPPTPGRLLRLCALWLRR